MIVHVFNYIEWRRVPDGMGCVDWDCNFHAVIVFPDGHIEKRPYNFQFHQNRLETEFPFRWMHKCDLSDHHKNIDVTSETEKLFETHPQVWQAINRWMPFVDRRIKPRVVHADS